MSSQLSAHAITAHTAMTRMSISRCSTLPAQRGSSSAEKCSTSFSTDIATLPSLSKGEPKRQSDRQNPASPFHASPLGLAGLATALLPIRSALAAYPEHPIKWIVAYAAGGGTDTLARILAETMSPKLGQAI